MSRHKLGTKKTLPIRALHLTCVWNLNLPSISNFTLSERIVIKMIISIVIYIHNKQYLLSFYGKPGPLRSDVTGQRFHITTIATQDLSDQLTLLANNTATSPCMEINVFC